MGTDRMTLLQIDNLIALLKQQNVYDPSMSLKEALALRAALSRA